MCHGSRVTGQESGFEVNKKDQSASFFRILYFFELFGRFLLLCLRRKYKFRDIPLTKQFVALSLFFLHPSNELHLRQNIDLHIKFIRAASSEFLVKVRNSECESVFTSRDTHPTKRK